MTRIAYRRFVALFILAVILSPALVQARVLSPLEDPAAGVYEVQEQGLVERFWGVAAELFLQKIGFLGPLGAKETATMTCENGGQLDPNGGCRPGGG
jgi:hypothetical protein